MLDATCIVLDFETTGLSPDQGDRITEVAAIRVANNQILEHYTSLANAGRGIPSFITQLTGISAQMIRTAPPVHHVIHELARFVGNDPIIAHNASFDRKFLIAEYRYAGLASPNNDVICTLRLARRLLPQLPNHKLSTIASHLGIRFPSDAHRAEADARVAAGVLLALSHRLAKQHDITVTPDLLTRIAQWPASQWITRLARYKTRVQDSTGCDTQPTA
jgi:DNA polymerase-3 subunit epsilon